MVGQVSAIDQRSAAGNNGDAELVYICCRVEYYIVDTFQDAWQRYRAYRSITLE